MAITFTQERKKQRYLILVLTLTLLSILFVVWRGFSGKKEVPPVSAPSVIFIPKQIGIDWELLKDPELKELQVPEEIPPFEGETGRENPFIPY